MKLLKSMTLGLFVLGFSGVVYAQFIDATAQVNPQITDAVTQANVKTVAEAPAQVNERVLGTSPAISANNDFVAEADQAPDMNRPGSEVDTDLLE